MVWDSLKDAKMSSSNLVNIWLDIKNGYGSIPHELIFFALERYGVPCKWVNIIRNYYSGLWSKSFSVSSPSSWFRHEQGIFAGCTISIILFLCGINVVIEYIVSSSVNPFVFSSNVSQPLVRAFMDDLDLMCVSIEDGQSLLSRAGIALKWARMQVRSDKSRSVIIKNGRVVNKSPFSLNEDSSSIPQLK